MCTSIITSLYDNSSIFRKGIKKKDKNRTLTVQTFFSSLSTSTKWFRFSRKTHYNLMNVRDNLKHHFYGLTS